MRLLIIALTALLLFLFPDANPASAGPPPFKVKSAAPSSAITAIFRQNEGWTGGDGAYSISLGERGALWLFGDSYLGKIRDGRREDPLLVNNTLSLLNFCKGERAMEFYWGVENGFPAAVFSPEKKSHFYWPGDGAYDSEALYLCFKELMFTDDGLPGFQFSWCGDTLIRVQNPDASPGIWRSKASPLPFQSTGTVTPHLGTACLFDNACLYLYGVYDQAFGSIEKGSVIVARISRSDLRQMNIKSLQYWCTKDNRYYWSSSPAHCAVLFTEGATEMTVQAVKGIEGYIATYTKGGMGPDIVIRHSRHPEGPWSDPLTAYHCPETGLYLYAGKAHSELSTKPGLMMITYCRNLASLEEDVVRPDVYFPQAVEVQLEMTVRRK